MCVTASDGGRGWQGRILVVQEKAGPAAARGKDFWKVPLTLLPPSYVTSSLP